MDPAIGIALTNIALKAARDCNSRKPKKRLQAAMNAVLDFDSKADEETALMAAIGGVMRVVDDKTGEYLQRELYGLGRISSHIQGLKEGEQPNEEEMALIDRDMPPVTARLGILVVWERCRVEHGLIRAIAMPVEEPADPADDWKK